MIVVFKTCFYTNRSNVSPDQPLRPKPPVSSSFRDTSSPNLSNSEQIGNNNFQYGVSNPEYYSATPTPTEGYGPNDFIVETVKLDKAFFHQVVNQIVPDEQKKQKKTFLTYLAS